MIQFKTPSIELTSSFARLSADHLIYEIGSKEEIEELEQFGLSSSFLEEVRKLLKKGKSFALDTYGPIGKIDRIHVVYGKPDAASIEETVKFASEYTRKLKWDIVWRVATGKNFLLRADILVLSTYQFQYYKTDNKEKKEQKLTIVREERTSQEYKDAFADRVRLLSAVCLARDLVNIPSGDKYPELLKDIILGLGWKNTEIRVVNKKEMEKLGFGCLLGVSKGSDREPYSMFFSRKCSHTDHAHQKIALAGKWVTFDAGGLQIKPDDGMLDMKCDMAGAASVVATLWYLDAFEELDRDIVAGIGLVENLLGGSAIKPLDVLTAYDKTTVEVTHTDAEGRLVLADIVSYLADTEKPDSIISIATLTGACIYALGYNYAGIIGNDAKMKKEILRASENMVHEKFIELPLDSDMTENIKSSVADLKNSTSGYRAGASMGAAFLEHFAGKSKFTHLDIAGPAFRTKPHSVHPEGATGFGVLTLSELLGSFN